MRRFWPFLLSAMLFIVSCGLSPSKQDLSYSSFFGDDPIDEEMFDEDTLVTEFDAAESEELDSAEGLSLIEQNSVVLKPVIDEDQEPFALQLESISDLEPEQVSPIESGEALVQSDTNEKDPHIEEHADLTEKKNLY